jgi:hypothetical protein
MDQLTKLRLGYAALILAVLSFITAATIEWCHP